MYIHCKNCTNPMFEGKFSFGNFKNENSQINMDQILEYSKEVELELDEEDLENLRFIKSTVNPIWVAGKKIGKPDKQIIEGFKSMLQKMDIHPFLMELLENDVVFEKNKINLYNLLNKYDIKPSSVFNFMY